MPNGARLRRRRSPARPTARCFRGDRRAGDRLPDQPHRFHRAAPARRRRRPAGEGRACRRPRGRIASFPPIIDPMCPFQDIRALTHEVTPGVWATCTMEGDTFEMEDQRNWTDASYKTYVRPLALPWPYTLPKGEKFEQAVTLDARRPAAEAGGAGGAKPVDRSPRRRAGTMPAIGSAFSRRKPQHALAAADLVKAAGAANVSSARSTAARRTSPQRSPHYRGLGASDRRGHRARNHPSAASVTRRTSSARIAAGGRAAGLKPAAIAVSPAVDLKAVLPGSPWPPVPTDAEDLCGRPRGLPRRQARRRHVLLFHRAQPQAPAGRAARLRHPHHLPDRACRRRRLGDGDAGGAALRHQLDQGAYQGQALSDRARAHCRLPRQPLWQGDLAPTRTTAASASPDGPAPARPFRRGLDARLCIAAFAHGGVEAIALGARPARPA